MINRIVSFVSDLLRLFRSLEGLLVDLAAAVAPWLAPIPSAVMLYAHMIGVLEFPIWAALASAVCVELLGLSAVSTSFTLWDYNDTRKQGEGRAPFLAALVTGCFYLVVVLTINTLLDQAEPLERVARASLTMLSPVGAVILAVRSNHARRVQSVEDARRQRSENLRLAREAKRLHRSPVMDTDPNPFGRIPERSNGNGGGHLQAVGRGGGVA